MTPDCIFVDGKPCKGELEVQVEAIPINEYETYPGMIGWKAEVYRWIEPGTNVLVQTRYGLGQGSW